MTDDITTDISYSILELIMIVVLISSISLHVRVVIAGM